MHIVGALVQRSCMFYDLHKIVVRIFEALTIGSDVHTTNKFKNHMPHVEIYEFGSCAPVPRPTMNYSVMSLTKAQALCTPPPITQIAGRLRLFAPP